MRHNLGLKIHCVLVSLFTLPNYIVPSRYWAYAGLGATKRNSILSIGCLTRLLRWSHWYSPCYPSCYEQLYVPLKRTWQLLHNRCGLQQPEQVLLSSTGIGCDELRLVNGDRVSGFWFAGVATSCSIVTSAQVHLRTNFDQPTLR